VAAGTATAGTGSEQRAWCLLPLAAWQRGGSVSAPHACVVCLSDACAAWRWQRWLRNRLPFDALPPPLLPVVATWLAQATREAQQQFSWMLLDDGGGLFQVVVVVVVVVVSAVSARDSRVSPGSGWACIPTRRRRRRHVAARHHLGWWLRAHTALGRLNCLLCVPAASVVECVCLKGAARDCCGCRPVPRRTAQTEERVTSRSLASGAVVSQNQLLSR
jgi:hypothetical protein